MAFQKQCWSYELKNAYMKLANLVLVNLVLVNLVLVSLVLVILVLWVWWCAQTVVAVTTSQTIYNCDTQNLFTAVESVS